MRPVSYSKQEAQPRRFALPLVLGFAGLLLALLPPRLGAQQWNLTGRWTDSSSTWGHMQIHMALLRGDGDYHSKIISWGEGEPTPASLWGWNRATDSADGDCSRYPLSITNCPLDTVAPNLFCSGHSILADGTLLIAGGHDKKNDIGLRQSILFRPNGLAGQSPSQQWVPQGTLTAGRW